MAEYKYGYAEDAPQTTTGEVPAGRSTGVGFQTIRRIESGILDLARNTVTDTLRATGAVANEAVSVSSDVLKGTAVAVDDTGTVLLGSTKKLAKNLILGVSDVGGDAIVAAGQTARTAVRGAADVGADVAVVARRTVEGVLDATKQVGGSVEEAAKSAVGGAINAAGYIGESAVIAVRRILVGVVDGVKEVAATALPKTDRQPGPKPLITE